MFRNRDVAYRVVSVLRAKKVRLRICNNQALDILNPAFDILLPILIELAQGEASSTSYRASGAHDVRAKRGEYRGGTVPFGMTTEKRDNGAGGVKSFLVPVTGINPAYPTELITGIVDGQKIMSPSHIKNEADLVKELFYRYTNGDSLTDIAEWINDCNFPSAKGANWVQTTVRRILSNPHYTGRVVHRGKVIKDSNGQDLICNQVMVSDETFALTQARLKSRGKASKRRNSYKLSGLIVCGSCGQRMSGRPGSNESNRSYSCRIKYVNKQLCPSPNHITAIGLEAFLYQMLSELATNKPEVLADLGKKVETVDMYAEKRAELTAKLVEIDSKISVEVDALSKEGLKYMRNIVTKELTDLEQDANAVATLAKVAFEGAAQFKQAWDSNSRQHLSLALGAIIDKVVILPKKKAKSMNWMSIKNAGWTVNLHRVEIHWANGTVMNMGAVEADVETLK
jgi:hypothetical protein